MINWSGFFYKRSWKKWNFIVYGLDGLWSVKSITYSVLVNGEAKGHIIPTRGIRQRDPLSPYLFLLCSEVLNGLIQHAVDVGEVKGVSLCRNGPKISHLFFADDSLLFCRAQIEDINTIQEILRKYEKASGQKINSEKTNLFFQQGCSRILQRSDRKSVV